MGHRKAISPEEIRAKRRRFIHKTLFGDEEEDPYSEVIKYRVINGQIPLPRCSWCGGTLKREGKTQWVCLSDGELHHVDPDPQFEEKAGGFSPQFREYTLERISTENPQTKQVFKKLFKAIIIKDFPMKVYGAKDRLLTGLAYAEWEKYKNILPIIGKAMNDWITEKKVEEVERLIGESTPQPEIKYQSDVDESLEKRIENLLSKVEKLEKQNKPD